MTAEPSLPVAVTQLLKGVVYRDSHDRAWRSLHELQPQARDYAATIGLDIVIDEAEGYAFCRQRDPDPDDRDPLPRLVPRRMLSFHVSLLLALLRKKLAEFDATGGDTRLVLSREQVTEMLRVFLPPTSNEARLTDQIDSYLNKCAELGFLRPVKAGAGDHARPGAQAFEVRRILKAFIDGQWLDDFDKKLAEYAAELSGEKEDAQ